MTFEEYRELRKKKIQRSISLTVFYSAVATFLFTMLVIAVLEIFAHGFSLELIATCVCIMIGIIYFVLCAIDGRTKKLQEAVYDLMLFLPY